MAPPAAGGAAPLLVGFHGYGENAEIWLDNAKTEATVGSWMTRLDREPLIADKRRLRARRGGPGAPDARDDRGPRLEACNRWLGEFSGT